jgi:hypothetical protein
MLAATAKCGAGTSALVNPDNCPMGIDRGHFDDCLTAIRAEECDHPLDTLSRLEKCRTSAMCLK